MEPLPPAGPDDWIDRLRRNRLVLGAGGFVAIVALLGAVKDLFTDYVPWYVNTVFAPVVKWAGENLGPVALALVNWAPTLIQGLLIVMIVDYVIELRSIQRGYGRRVEASEEISDLDRKVFLIRQRELRRNVVLNGLVFVLITSAQSGVPR